MINYDDNLVKTDWGLEETVYPKTYGELNRVVIELIKQVVNMKGATSSADGTSGLVPAPAAGSQATKYLRADGTWQVPPDTKYTHPNSGVTAGTYKSVTVNAQGHVTSGSNPTTLSGYGITDAPTKTGSGASGTWDISVSGNAATATKATQDSAGQQINTTYIKGLSVSGTTITHTKGDGSTGTITTQDTAYSTPRYNAGISVTINTYGYTATAAGLLCGGTAQGRDLGQCYFQVNGANVYNMMNYGTEGIPLFVIVKKGDVIRTTDNSFTCILYPF